jgi:WD40 repeat protein
MNLTKHWAATLDDYAIDLAWSPATGADGSGSVLAAASAAGPVTLFAAADGAKLHLLPGHDNGTNAVAFAPAHCPPSAYPVPLLATGGQDGCVKLWDPANGQHTATAKLGSGWVEHLAWRPSANPPSSNLEAQSSPLLLFAAAGKNLAALRADGSVAHLFPPAPKTIIALAAQSAGGCVAAAHFGGVQLWDADDFLLQKELPYVNGIHALVWSPDSRWLVSGNQDPSVHLWLPEKNEELHMSGYEGKVRELSFDHTSRWLATGGGHDACIWDCSGAGPEGREPLMLPHDAKICAVAFQNSHGLLATASADGTVMLWSVDRRQPLRATVKMPSPATKLAWSPDDTLLAIAAESGAVYVLRCVA